MTYWTLVCSCRCLLDVLLCLLYLQPGAQAQQTDQLSHVEQRLDRLEKLVQQWTGSGAVDVGQAPCLDGEVHGGMLTVL
jgi:hypothetical protein